MDKPDSLFGAKTQRALMLRLGIINYGVLGLFLFLSEFINAVFNNVLDGRGYGLLQRIAFAFKPTVIVIYLASATILFLVILRFLKPLFRYLLDGSGYQVARTAAIRIPWTILIFQIVFWTLGTTVYYALYRFNAESGIPYGYGLLLKIGVGVMAGMYSAILINLSLIPAKSLLAIREVRPGENDGFARIRDTLVAIAIAVYISILFSYVVYYYARRGGSGEMGPDFYVALVALCLLNVAIATVLVLLSRFEYRLQVQSIAMVVKGLASRSSNLEDRINIQNFNELGEIAGHVNRILDNVASLLLNIRSTSEKISESTKRVASTSQQNAAYSNEQAAAATEVVSTMEGVDTLSKQVGAQIRLVADQSVSVKEHVRDGFFTIQQNMSRMDQVKQSYGQTIEGIRTLGEHISGVWEIVKIINTIAGQIKIIAFNAALEASSAGEAGKNFEIVASEIRRLADNTVASTTEIKERIREMEEASDRLVRSSETDSEQVREAWEMSQKIEGLFSSILEASEHSAGSAEEIQDSVQKQVGAFEQILITMRQISEGISEFAQTIDENTDTAHTLEETARTLDGITESYANKNEVQS